MKRPSTKSRETLRALRDAEAAKVAQSALRTGEVSEEELDALDRLSRLVEIEDARPPTWRSRAPLIAVTIATLIVVSVLFFARVTSTDIELDVEVTRVRFALPSRQTVTDMLPLSRLGVGRLREAVIPRARNLESQALRSDEGEVAVQVEPATIADRQGTVTLAGLALPPATSCRSPTAACRDSTASRSMPRPPISTSRVSGPTDLRATGAGRQTLDFDVPGDLVLHSGKNGLFFDLSLQDGSRGGLARQLPARDLSLQDVDETIDGNRTIVRRVSAIVSGTLYLEAIDGKERTLRAGELLQFSRSEGELRSVRLEDDRIVLNFQGTVQGMTIGRGDNQISLMPTWLEWIQARHGVSLFWGSALYLCGAAIAVFKWLKGRE